MKKIIILLLIKAIILITTTNIISAYADHPEVSVSTHKALWGKSNGIVHCDEMIKSATNAANQIKKGNYSLAAAWIDKENNQRSMVLHHLAKKPNTSLRASLTSTEKQASKLILYARLSATKTSKAKAISARDLVLARNPVGAIALLIKSISYIRAAIVKAPQRIRSLGDSIKNRFTSAKYNLQKSPPNYVNAAAQLTLGLILFVVLLAALLVLV